MIDLLISDVNVTLKMGWSFVSIGITSEKKKYVYSIEQMVGEPDILYVTNTDSALLPKEEVVNSLSEIKWNRDIIIIEADGAIPSIDINEKEYQIGTIESTKAGEEFLGLDLFDPTCDIERVDVHQAWCNLEERFAEGVEGQVNIQAGNIRENSIFNKITIPVLMNNSKAILKFID
ncbi:hypothetical protein [Paucisalibacillus globulus]|uniref:hypothetical protein n=1 Tax=Paucisalibacillus globulus TaxID=351095 RepID=UPI0003FA89AA|nr:hypothetical protein [Paucisalibacillus globulus]